MWNLLTFCFLSCSLFANKPPRIELELEKCSICYIKDRKIPSGTEFKVFKVTVTAPCLLVIYSSNLVEWETIFLYSVHPDLPNPSGKMMVYSIMYFTQCNLNLLTFCLLIRGRAFRMFFFLPNENVMLESSSFLGRSLCPCCLIGPSLLKQLCFQGGCVLFSNCCLSLFGTRKSLWLVMNNHCFLFLLIAFIWLYLHLPFGCRYVKFG